MAGVSTVALKPPATGSRMAWALALPILMFIHAALFAHEREHIADEAGRAREVVLLPDDLVLPGGREEVVIAPRPLRRRHKACIDAGREHETMRGHPVAVGVAVLRRQLLAVGGGELPH